MSSSSIYFAPSFSWILYWRFNSHESRNKCTRDTDRWATIHGNCRDEFSLKEKTKEKKFFLGGLIPTIFGDTSKTLDDALLRKVWMCISDRLHPVQHVKKHAYRFWILSVTSSVSNFYLIQEFPIFEKSIPFLYSVDYPFSSANGETHFLFFF